jgi:hypothetical protein
MQGYQIHATALAACYCLLPSSADRRRRYKRLSGNGACPGLPGLPGHARHLRSYLPGRHRRRQ